MAVLFNCLPIKPEMISEICVRVSVAQVVKAQTSSSMNNIAFERGFDPCKGQIFFQDEGG